MPILVVRCFIKLIDFFRSFHSLASQNARPIDKIASVVFEQLAETAALPSGQNRKQRINLCAFEYSPSRSTPRNNDTR